MASLNLRQGALGKRLANHLLRRGTFQITKARIESFANMTADQAVDDLFVIPPYVHPEGPVNYLDGVTAWLTTGPYENNPGQLISDTSVQLWLYNELMHDTSIRHKMVYFWHSIFVTGADQDWKTFDLWRLFQFYALGNIKTLARKVTMDNKMLKYLDNNLNSKHSPNENYAREFLELFTIQKGEQISADNYTTYTESDISQAARVLSGFKSADFDNKDPETGLATGIPQYNIHDIGNKTFSPAFNSQEILGAVDEADMIRELVEFIDMVFNQQQTARSYCKKLYRYFVSDNITSEVETDIIEPLSLQLMNDDYEVEQTLKILLKSEHFYDEDDSDNSDEIIGGKIKSPLELWFSTVNLFNANQIGVLNNNTDVYFMPNDLFIYFTLIPLGWPQYPETVEGYPGFFKSPNYSNNWFEQSNIAFRYLVGEALVFGKALDAPNPTDSIPFQVDITNFFLTEFTNQEYSSFLVTQLLEIAFPEMPDAQRQDYFRQKLLGGLSDISYLIEWQNYLDTLDDTNIKIAFENLFVSVIGSPEFQTY